LAITQPTSAPFPYTTLFRSSTRAIPIICPECEKPTKMLGVVDACMHCKQPLTLEKTLEGKDFDEKYNSPAYRKKLRAEKADKKSDRKSTRLNSSHVSISYAV